MRLISIVAAIYVALAPAAYAQTFDHLGIQVRGLTVRANGAEVNSVWYGGGPLVIGESEAAVFWIRGCSRFHVSGPAAFPADAVTGWRADFTPIRVVDDAVTFRLRWIRVVDKGNPGAAGEDLELTLRPGESRPLDMVRIPADVKADGGDPCTVNASTLRVSVEHHPGVDQEQRLVAADLWLVERLPDGRERSQTLSVRGLPNRPMPFYFDRLMDGTSSIEIFGQIVARIEKGAIRVALQTRKKSLPTLPFDRSAPFRDRADSIIQVKPDEIVEVQLPKLGTDAGPFANRQLSIRIRSRQLR